MPKAACIAVLLALATLSGCGGAPHTATRPPPPKQNLKAEQAKKLAVVRTLKHAVTETKNVAGRRSGCEGGAAPAFSPDGMQIAFAGGGAICLANRDGSHIHAVPNTSVDSAFRLAWVSSTLLLVDDAYAISPVSLSGKPPKFARGVEAPSFTVSGNGQRFATGTQSDCPDCVGQATVWTMAGKEVGAIGDATDFYDAPSLSPDGKQVVYGQGQAVWLSNADGSGARQLVADGGTPLWSPTADEIAYTNATGLWVVASSGGKPRLVTSGATDNGGWSPNGKFVAYWDSGGVKVVTVGNGKVRSYPLVGFPDFRASAWSPDSRDLLVTAGLTAHCSALWLEPLNGPRPQLLSSCY